MASSCFLSAKEMSVQNILEPVPFVCFMPSMKAVKFRECENVWKQRQIVLFLVVLLQKLSQI
jgi:hypothetical protein